MGTQRFITLFYFHRCLNFFIIKRFFLEYDVFITKNCDEFLPKIGGLHERKGVYGS